MLRTLLTITAGAMAGAAAAFVVVALTVPPPWQRYVPSTEEWSLVIAKDICRDWNSALGNEHDTKFSPVWQDGHIVFRVMYDEDAGADWPVSAGHSCVVQFDSRMRRHAHGHLVPSAECEVFSEAELMERVERVGAESRRRERLREIREKMSPGE